MEKDCKKIRVLEEMAEVLDKRAYFTIGSSGEIKRKEMNYALPLTAFCKDEKFLEANLPLLADSRERTKIDKIERYSNKTVEELKDKLYKLLANGNVDFAKRYGKELFLKDREEFYRTLFHYGVMDSKESMKPLMALSMKKLLGERYNENIMYLVISYFAKVKPDFYQYENAKVYSGSISDLEQRILKNREGIHTKEFLQIYSSLLALKGYNYPREEFIAGKIEKAVENFEKNENKTASTEIETIIIDSLLS